MQDKAEAKLRGLEAKAEEQRKVKEAAAAQWRAQQRDRELVRLKVLVSISLGMTHCLPHASLMS